MSFDSVLAPTSRGAVTLRTANPEAAPRITHNYLTTEADQACVVAGIRMALQIAGQAALKDVITGAFDVPGSDTDADLLAFAKRSGRLAIICHIGKARQFLGDIFQITCQRFGIRCRIAVGAGVASVLLMMTGSGVAIWIVT